MKRDADRGKSMKREGKLGGDCRDVGEPKQTEKRKHNQAR